MQQQLLWNVAVWPGQSATWTVRRRQEDGQGGGKALAVEELSSWESRLEMDLPFLGHLDARICLRGDTLSLRMQASLQARKSLQAKIEELRSALELLGLQANIRLEPENA
ncbi:flagellar hook-length control protein FliK [Acidithiobacillus sp. AMEEHan]|uniref:flagellar hook-length control protein FliK n=1 Tax=Acidithiobacillus sp. AMEEHan TaxID=2994951 RepID=UPI0027E5413E|nr:flagellar hook-length control protein FliK [Acidithiobacillus sp. AMEEHan]